MRTREERRRDDAEHRRDAADAEAEHDDGQRAERALFNKDAQTDTEILAKGFKHWVFRRQGGRNRSDWQG